MRGAPEAGCVKKVESTVVEETPDIAHLVRLFKKLDLDGDGRINVNDLSVALKKRGVNKPDLQANFILSEGDTNDSGDITLDEFIEYARRHERKLKIVFNNIDRNNDGKLDVGEIIEVCREVLGIEFRNEEEVRAMIRRWVWIFLLVKWGGLWLC